nr:uncharacterized protein LOC123759621 isoform X1 [Procambarus clarkii]
MLAAVTMKFALISLLVGIVAAEGPRWCELPASCQPGQLVPHPWDCHQYHLCVVGGVPHSTPLRCPHRHYFHPAWRRCLPEDTPCLPQCPRACPCHLLRQGRLVPHHHNCRPAQLLHVDTGHCLDTRCLNFCGDRAKVAPLVTRNVTRVSGSVVVSDQCKFSCNGDFSKYADHYDCSLYYQCFSGGITVPASCPGNFPYFDGEDCVTDNSACCADLTTTTTTTTTTTPGSTLSPATPPTATTKSPSTTRATKTTTTTTTSFTPTTITTPTTTGATPSIGCITEPDCSDKPFGHLEGDPDDCFKFYFCLGDGTISANSVNCPIGEFFNPSFHTCQKIVGDTFHCPQPCDSLCPYTCAESDRIYDPFDCSKYYLCIEGTPIHLPCTESVPYFNGTTCVASPDSCCRFPCPPYCPRGGVFVPHGQDCHKYYICVDVGTPLDTAVLTCKDNQVYDYKLRKCSATAECKILC